MLTNSATREHSSLMPALGGDGRPVVIVGAGPTGVMLAIELARRGIEVRVLDKQSSRPSETRAIGIHARTLEVMHQLGLVEEFLALGHRVDGVIFHLRGQRRAQVRFGHLDTPHPFLLTLSQEHTQRILDERLESLGVSIERGVDVVDVRQDTEGAEVLITAPGRQREQVLHAGWVVGCDGVQSIVRRRLGLAFDGEDYGQDWLMAEVTTDWPVCSDRFHIFAHSPAVLAMFPLSSNRWRLFLPQVPGRGPERRPPDIEEIERLVAQRGPKGMRVSDPTLFATFRCYLRSTKTMRSGRVLIAGDAAHVHSPAGGQGLNTGLHDAFNLGWKLALVAQGQAPPGLLDTYQAERVPIATSVLGLTHGLVRTFSMPSSRKRFVRDLVLPIAMSTPVAQRRYTRRLSQLAHNYRGGPLAARSSRGQRNAPLPGDRLPSVSGLDLAGRPVCTLDLLDSTKHTLLVFAGATGDGRAFDAIAGPLARWGALVQTIPISLGERSTRPIAVSDPGLRAHRRYHATRGRLLLVRPDGYLACRAPLDRPDIPGRYLERLTAQMPAPTPTSPARPDPTLPTPPPPLPNAAGPKPGASNRARSLTTTSGARPTHPEPPTTAS
jgi:2-polyprenyl-6-methoxyphenol hydroxylase-like FAD-dependent oxidoreductase